VRYHERWKGRDAENYQDVPLKINQQVRISQFITKTTVKRSQRKNI
jgi:hypothetical protein